MRPRLFPVFVLALALLFLPGAGARADATLARVQFLTATGAHTFHVEVMRTPAELSRGLMYRRYMPDDRGMLFLFGVAEPVSFWMKNTYIPLDMIFLDRRGRVTKIAADTEPLSERLVPSGGPIWAVVELNAGAAAAMGLKVGDRAEGPDLQP